MASGYSFGDTPRAAERLGVLADVFAPLTTSFVAREAPQAPRRLLDLGCGPGHTTALLVAAVRPGATVAVDASPAYVARAQAALGAAVDLRRADVTDLPPDLDDFDVIYARFLLTHLAAPLEAVAHWLDRLAPGGRLLLEEVDALDATEPAQRRYLELQRAMLDRRGHRLDVGGRLAAATSEGWNVLVSRVVEFAPGDAAAASMFALNVDALRAEEAGEPYELDEIESDLRRLATDRAAPATTRWRMRQMVIGRAA